MRPVPAIPMFIRTSTTSTLGKNLLSLDWVRALSSNQRIVRWEQRAPGRFVHLLLERNVPADGARTRNGRTSIDHLKPPLQIRIGCERIGCTGQYILHPIDPA